MLSFNLSLGLNLSEEIILDMIRYQFSSVGQSCLTLCSPMDGSMLGFPVHHHSQSLLKLMSIDSVMPSNHLTLCHPLLLPPSIVKIMTSLAESK